MTVWVDIQGIQSRDSGLRGIGRYVLEMALGLEARDDRARRRYLLNPGLPVPATAERLVASGRVELSDRVAVAPGDVFHVAAPFESVRFDQLWPPSARRPGVRLAATLYDVIPTLYPEHYLPDENARRRFANRLEVLRQADRVLAISEAAGRDAVTHLGIRPERVRVIGTGVSEGFGPARDQARALEAAQRSLPWLRPGFVLYAGAHDPRKNVPRLLEAYAGLPPGLRAAHPLVLASRVSAAERADLARRLRELGAAGDVRLAEDVDDELLGLLYQSTALFVFPSLYEGFGLPAAEALACGAPTIAARTSSLVEIVTDSEAQFEPTDVEGMRSTLRRALEDEAFRARLSTAELDPRHRWSEVARRLADVYDELAALPPRRRVRRPRLAFVGPLPPLASGVATANRDLVEAVVRHCDVDVFCDEHGGAPIDVPAQVGLEPLAAFDRVHRARGGYDQVVVALGDDAASVPALGFLRRHRAVVLLPGARLTALYAAAARERPDIEPRGFEGAVAAMYGDRVLPHVGASGRLPWAAADRFGIFLLREVLDQADLALLPSRHAAQLARLDATPAAAGRIDVLPFAAPSGVGRADAGGVRLVSFSAAHGPGQLRKLLHALPELAAEVPGVTLVVADDGERETADDLADAVRSGLPVRQALVTHAAERDTLLAGSDVAVQLWAAGDGAFPPALGACLAAGLVTVVTAFGAGRELPDSVVVKADRDLGPDALADLLGALLGDGDRRRALSEAAAAFAAARPVDRLAERLVGRLFHGRPLSGRRAA